MKDDGEGRRIDPLAWCAVRFYDRAPKREDFAHYGLYVQACRDYENAMRERWALEVVRYDEPGAPNPNAYAHPDDYVRAVRAYQKRKGA